MTKPKTPVFQTTLFGDADSKQPERPPRGICTEACFMAVNEQCNCACGGVYHGLGRNKIRELNDPQQHDREAAP